MLPDGEAVVLFKKETKGQISAVVRSGIMAQCYMDLCFLLYQRTTDIRLLRWSMIGEEGIPFTPTKTEDSSGVRTLIPMNAEIRAVLERARKAGTVKSFGYVIHTKDGSAYTANGIRSVFKRAQRRAGLKGYTLKDIRPMAATMAAQAGATLEQLRVALGHTSIKTTETYMKARDIPVSQVSVSLPTRVK
jgi:integrase